MPLQIRNPTYFQPKKEVKMPYTAKDKERIKEYYCYHPEYNVKMELLHLIRAAERYQKVGMIDEAFSCLAQGFDRGDQFTTYPIIRKYRNEMARKVRDGKIADTAEANHYMRVVEKYYQITAPAVFEDFLIFTEWNRSNEQKFYMPRRKGLLPIVKVLQDLADDKLDLACVSCPPGIGKTALATFYITWLVGRNPEKGILVGSHSQSFLKGVYEDCIREMTPGGDYQFQRAFWGRKIVKTNAADLKIDVENVQRFSSLQFASIGSEMAGKVRAQGLLYLDDLIGRMEEALNAEYLDKLWQEYTVDYRQRKQGGCKELHIATRWATKDVIGRLKEKYGDDERAAFIEMPALNENDESNFDYGGDIGFSTAMYHNLRADMDSASWDALYMARPVDRNALLYGDETLRKYYSLPEGSPDAILAVCDTAEGGGDYTVMPIFYVYGNDHYLVDVVCSDGLPEITDEMCANALIRNNVQQCQFESNAAGGRTADKIQELVKKKLEGRGGRECHITKKRTTQNKETKIIVNSAWIKQHCLFLDDTAIKRGTDYADFMKQMRSYTSAVKNKHDDTVDALAQYALFTDNLIGNVATVVRRPF